MRSLGYIMGHHDAMIRNAQTWHAIAFLALLWIAAGVLAYTLARLLGGTCKW